MLTIKDLRASYDGVPALHGVNLDIHENEYVGLIGPNGAGKTTLLKTLSGVVDADQGEVSFADEDLLSRSTHERVNLGLVHVPQGRRVFPTLTVEENLRMGAFRPDARDGSEAQLDVVYELFPALKDVRLLSGGALSGGQQQMLAIGRGLMARPRLLMLDEPSMGLAPLIVEQIFDALGQLRSGGELSVLLVEQLAHEAMELCSRVYVLESGEVVASGEATQLATDKTIVEAYLGQS